MSRLTLRHFECLNAVARHRHFGRAATELGVGQPFLSLAIQRLEETLGEPLVVRRPAVTLTAAGVLVERHAVRLLREARAARTGVEDLADGASGELRLGFPNWMAMTPLFERIAVFRERLPDVRMRFLPMSSRSQLEQLRRGVLDVAFVREAALDEADYAKTALLSEPFLIAVADSHPLATRDGLSLVDFRGEHFLLFPREPAPEFHDLMRGLLARQGIVSNPMAMASDWLTILGLVAVGAGVALVPHSMSAVRLKGLAFLAAADLDDASTISAVTACGQVRPLVARFVDFLRSSGANWPPDGARRLTG
ncbi:MAG: LysR family transcriptional regulator [Sphingomonas sp.]